MKLVDPAEETKRRALVEHVNSLGRYVNEIEEAERKIVRLSNLYAALSQMNGAILRGRSRDDLLRDICRISVDYGRFELAWVGLVEEGTSRVRVAASHGHDGGYLDGILISVDPSEPHGRGPIGTSIREQRSYVCNDFFADPITVPWRAAAQRVGFRAIATFPVTFDGRTIGALAVYAAEVGFFDEASVSLLEEMMKDVSFALDNLAREERRRAAEEALEESEEKYRLLFVNERDAIILHDMDTHRILEANEAFRTLYGYSREEALDLRVLDLSAEKEATARALQSAREKGFERVAARRHRKKDGTEFWVEISASLFVWHGQRVATAIIRDITERKEAEERTLLWSKVMEESAEGIVVTNAATRILTVNKAFTEVTGYSPEDAIGASPKLLSSGQHGTAFYRTMWRTIAEGGRWQGEIWNRRKSGEVYPEWLSITAVRDAEGVLTHYVGIFTDITERKESADRIEFLASHDFLTGLPNRPLMNDLIRQGLANARRKDSKLALFFLDLDRFKTINDSLGHHVGDALLQGVASRLTECLRAGDTVARLGGDEFLVLLPDLRNSQDAAPVAEKILQAMQRTFVVQERELRITTSIGISLYPHDGDDLPSLVKNADAAMYHAKDVGRNSYQFFTPDMNARAFESLSMEMSLRRALERREFTLLYQPQLQTETGRLVGAEALIRWRHPDLGLVLPSTFIPIAEQHGLILPIGDWVLEAVCTQIRAWLDDGLPVVPVAVNMSAIQFRQPALADRIGRILSETGLDPRLLELELTESSIMHEAERTISLLRQLEEMGLSLSIDDFGTGYSSLSYLRRFPIDKLKIDQSFVRDITTDPDAAAITTAIIAMGRSLKLRVVAEGVETAEQLEFLRSQHCDEVQGFHVGRPMSAGDFAALLLGDRPSGSAPRP